VGKDIEGGTLHIGLLSLDRRHFLSPTAERPALFTAPYAEGEGTNLERQAHSAVSQAAGIIASSLYSLLGSDTGIHRGYLLREASPRETLQHGLTPFSTEQLAEFIRDIAPQEVTGHFLRQIIKYMPLPPISHERP